MARPITVTPKLDAQSACVFLGRMVNQKTSRPVPTPKIEKEIIMAKKQKKQKIKKGKVVEPTVTGDKSKKKKAGKK